ncbi:hypothetical protein HPB48_005709 [Haemaphysalis longicornis]|uniref:Uncharacterized protein n=1 Tax=Haemaphysalis longicornis TaxID=44386 RepID=A0A9J6FD39_HAELO|nr:hypothetical protein HPB48_005709 [Haemaphysalis longicornis]
MAQAACVLHDMLKGEQCEPLERECSTGSHTLFSLKHSKGRPGAVAVAVRERLSDYFSGDGAVSWQDARAGVDVSGYKKKATRPKC